MSRHKIGPKVSPIASPYAREYLLGEDISVVTFMREGDSLFFSMPGESKTELFAASKTKFFVRTSLAKFEFAVDDKGVVIGLTLDWQGQRILGKKLKQ